jgi:tetratricopeptide (TPR) repeat protein
VTRLALAVLVTLAAGAFACRSETPEAGPAGSGATSAATPAVAGSALQAADALVQNGQLDEALSRLDAAAGDADSLALLGVIWSMKAKTAPLPTPPPPAPGAKRGSVPQAPEFKEEELTALGFLEKALVAQPSHPRAALALAELLAPHALRQADLRQAAQRTKGARAPEAVPADGVDFSLERVGQAYRAAAASGSPESIERIYAFAVRAGRLQDAEWALEQAVARDKENPAPLIRFGDFLVQQKKDPRGAIERYREALIWRPDDEATLGKIADIYIAEAIESYNRNQYAVAQSRLLEAQKFVRNPNSPQGLRIKDYLSKLGSIRQNPR